MEIFSIPNFIAQKRGKILPPKISESEIIGCRIMPQRLGFSDGGELTAQQRRVHHFGGSFEHTRHPRSLGVNSSHSPTSRERCGFFSCRSCCIIRRLKGSRGSLRAALAHPQDAVFSWPSASAWARLLCDGGDDHDVATSTTLVTLRYASNPLFGSQSHSNELTTAYLSIHPLEQYRPPSWLAGCVRRIELSSALDGDGCSCCWCNVATDILRC